MSLLTFLFGCKQIPVKGLDFSSAVFKVIHLDAGLSIEYEMPGNMSKYFNYDQRYKEESERTLNIELSEDLRCQKSTWQKAYEFDGATWEYTAGKSQGLNGELGNISINLFIGCYTGDIQVYITQAYDTYLNGSSGPNSEARAFGAREGRDEDEIAQMLMEGPKALHEKKINNASYLYWTMEKEFSDRPHTYFLYVINKKYYFSVRFDHGFSVKSDEELAGMKQQISSDVEKFMSRVVVKVKSS